MWQLLPVLVLALGLSPIQAIHECRCDLCFVVDESGSIGEWTDMIQFMKDFVNSMTIGQDNHLVGLVEFNHDPTPIFSLNDDRDTILNKLDATTQASGGTDIEEGIAFAKNFCFGPGSGEREDAANVMIVITDGGSWTGAAADLARDDGIIVLAVGVEDFGNPPDESTLLDIAGQDEEYVFIAGDFSTLVKDIATVYNRICENCMFDICFVVDESGSVSSATFDKIQLFLASFIQTIDVGFAHYLVGLVEFNFNGDLIFDLNDYPTRPELATEFAAMNYNNGWTDIGEGIQKAREVCFGTAGGDRPWAPNIMIVITDGHTQDTQNAINEANLASNDGIIMVAIGVDVPLNMNMIEDIALNVAGHSFNAGGDITTLVPEINSLMDKLCDEACMLDICFVVDESGSMVWPTDEKWWYMKTFMMGLITRFQVGPQNVLFGLVEFDGSGDLQFPTGQHTWIGSLLAAISSTTPAFGGTSVASGIIEARNNCFNVDRPNSHNVMIVMTDAGTNIAAAVTAANDTRSLGMTVLVIGVGDGVSTTAIEDIAGGSDNAFFAPTQFSWIPLVTEFEDLIRDRWCTSKVHCVAVYSEHDIWDFEGNAHDLPNVKQVLLSYVPSVGDACQMEVGWDRRDEPFDEKWITIHTGVHPVNSAKFYRQVDFDRLPHIVTDVPTQRGWKCKETNEDACPGEFPTFSSYPYDITRSGQPTYAVVNEISMNNQYDVIQDNACDMWYELSYYFNHDVGAPMVILSIDEDFYWANKNELSGWCVA